ncbi:thioredoxin domain-containing protein [Alicyclobacillus dauci]|uniref:Thioredoxin domain-containing protein n=1 Tax=Alicyclobacillus dauci TaxID=1475485 RepID=A0ABY6Z864_9BACL|nr:thioredoxin domain-containing protein [Alicyclobacillus dauci]WAH38782.1 thioredoxin domain-containing protein [Alicyclobacillus dauci]
MAHESFEDETVADYLNQHYISIKVDREERPDIDHIYMMYCQALTGEGGWPLTVIMTPEGHPFFAGTYFPKTSRYGRPGLLDILSQLNEKWATDNRRLRAASEDISERLQPIFAAAPGSFDPKTAVHQAAEKLGNRFDPLYGGFGDAPKFPTFHQLMFLLRYHRYTGENDALQMVQKTLTSISRGGIFDHVGGGLARYSTDTYWRVPHFEKMLYDNALAVLTYTEAYQQTKDTAHKWFVDSVLHYVEREMTSEGGAFYAAQDADSEGQEGRFYVWRPDDVTAALGEELGELYCDFYDITDEGNFEGYNVPNFIETDVETFASSRGLTIDALWAKLRDANEQLYEWREHRVHPGTDDKVLTAWNALMITALAKAGAAFHRSDYVMRAVRAANFIEKQLVRQDGRLLARYRDGEAGIVAYSDDYAYLIWAYLELYQATLDGFYLRRAIHWQKQLDEYFWDINLHGYFLSGHDAEELIARPKTVYDGATPSANSVSGYNLARLYAITGDAQYADKEDKLFAAFAEMLNEAPTEHLFLLMASLLVYGGTTEVVAAVGEGNRDVEDFVESWHQAFVPEAVILEPQARGEEGSIYPAEQNQLTVYVCRHFQCDRPDLDWKSAIERIIATPPRF